MIIPFPGLPGADTLSGPGDELGDCRLMARALSMTKHMLRLAEIGDWAGVTECERLRRDDINSCFDRAATPENGELIAEALAAILHLNEELLEHLRRARFAVMEAGSDHQRSKQALVSYADHSVSS